MTYVVKEPLAQVQAEKAEIKAQLQPWQTGLAT